MRAFVAVTDENWFEQLKASSPVEEVSFWRRLERLVERVVGARTPQSR